MLKGCRSRAWGVLVCLLAGFLAASPGDASFVTFETGQVRPLALSPDGTRLFALNTPDNRLEVFLVGPATLSHVGSVGVGLEPIAVAARTDSEVWVVNHLSDSVSVIDVASTPPRVTRTLLVGDEPRDIVFAGPTDADGHFLRAFVTTARRGQNVPPSVPPLLTTPSTPRALVWTFDASNLGSSLGGDPLSIIELFGDTPRALAATADGGTVYAAVFHSGNQTTTVAEGAVCDDSNVNGAPSGACNVAGVIMPGGLPPPETNADGDLRPEVGLIVKYNPVSGHWEDELDRNWDPAVKFSLPDEDVFAIDATANPPQQAVGGVFDSVGTILFNMAVNPLSGKVYVSNTEARNEVRFEGPGIFTGSTVNGHLHEARITVLDGANVEPRHLNKHIDYGVFPSPPAIKEDSLAIPTDLAVTGDGSTLYVAAFGSSKIGVFDTALLENDLFAPDGDDHIPVSGGGPSGLALDEERDLLFVFTRFDNSISVIDTNVGAEVAHVSLHNPEPPQVVHGRPILYDAVLTSSNGEASCASCHIFGDFDSLAWDLGNPDDTVLINPNPMRVDIPPAFFPSMKDFHPMKGPMTTQSLRGMANHGPMHWRGDRTGGNDPGGDALDEEVAFKKFIVAFEGLLGRDGPISDADMQAFTDFILQVTYPPNPIRALDNSLTVDEQAGRNFFLSNLASDVFQPCHGCHVLDPDAGFFGSDGFSSFEFEPQFLKIPHLRNLYQKVGMFGMPAVPFFNSGNNGDQGPQVRGFGFLHDGSTDTIFRFHDTVVFNQTNPAGFPLANPGGFPNGAAGDPARAQVEAFMLAFDSNLAPIVGQQTTLNAGNGATVGPRIDLLIARAAANECDLTVHGTVAGELRGWHRLPDGTFQSDRAAEAPLGDGALRALSNAAGQDLTYTCVPPGSGQRIGVDRDEDGFFDRDELDACSSPQDPIAIPGGTTARLVAARKVLIKNKTPDDETKNKIVILAKNACIETPAPESAGDPRCGSSPVGTVKARIRVRGALTGDTHTTDLPCQNWKLIGKASNPKGYKYKDKELDDGTAKILVWKNGKMLKAVLQGKGPSNLDYDLQQGVSQGLVEVAFATNVDRVCLGCMSAKGKDGSDGKKFLGKSTTCPAPSTCPAP